jgi:hypothetical protein
VFRYFIDTISMDLTMRTQKLPGIVKVNALIFILFTGIVQAAPPITKVEFAIEPQFATAGDFSEGV